jgi:hypothetical protein
MKHGEGSKKLNKKLFYNKPFWHDAITGIFYDEKPDLLEDKANIEYWDSDLEFKVYQKLLTVFSYEQIKRQHIVKILPKKFPFSAWTWCCDFIIDKLYLVEAKGEWLNKDEPRKKEFVHALRVLMENDPKTFARLTIVDRSSWKIGGTNINVVSLSNLNDVIQSKMKLY